MQEGPTIVSLNCILEICANIKIQLTIVTFQLKELGLESRKKPSKCFSSFHHLDLYIQLISLEITQLNDLLGNLNHLDNIIPEFLGRIAYVPSKIFTINGFNFFLCFLQGHNQCDSRARRVGRD